jgi:hypothetical protein
VEKALLVALLLMSAGITKYLRYTLGMAKTPTWKGWILSYVVAIGLSFAAIEGPNRLIWCLLGMLAIIAGEVCAWLSQLPDFPYTVLVTTRRLFEGLAFLVFVWIQVG